MIWPAVKSQLQLQLQLPFLKEIRSTDEASAIASNFGVSCLFLLLPCSVFCDVRVTKPAQAPTINRTKTKPLIKFSEGHWIHRGWFFSQTSRSPKVPCFMFFSWGHWAAFEIETWQVSKAGHVSTPVKLWLTITNMEAFLLDVVLYMFFCRWQNWVINYDKPPRDTSMHACIHR